MKDIRATVSKFKKIQFEVFTGRQFFSYRIEDVLIFKYNMTLDTTRIT